MAPDILSSFDGFRAELDAYSDRRERLIKVVSVFIITDHAWIVAKSLSQASRDVTNVSKKIIFLLHRIMTENTTDTDRALSLRAASAGRAKLAEVTSIYASIRPELQGDRFWRYYRCVSPGIQEFIEAVSFMHYLEYGTLITHAEVQHVLSDESNVPVSVYKDATMLRHTQWAF